MGLQPYQPDTYVRTFTNFNRQKATAPRVNRARDAPPQWVVPCPYLLGRVAWGVNDRYLPLQQHTATRMAKLLLGNSAKRILGLVPIIGLVLYS